jgi:hypothetical protein
VTVVTVALDFDPEKARPWIEAAAPSHPALVDSEHRIDELFGISNVPMAVWIDETGTLVRPAESASIQPSQYASMEVSDDLPEQLRLLLTEMQQMPDIGEAYRTAIVDWAERGADSPFALVPHAVIAASQPRSADHSRAAACFEMGRHLHENGDKDAAIPWWKEAHALFPENWTYKRQAWTLESTPEGADSDMGQEVHDVYGTSWSEEFLRTGGANYGILPEL